jgi:SPP1 gp7 family putative phage head morphogenesis protein
MFSRSGDIRTEKQVQQLIHGVNCTCHKTAIKTPDFLAPKNYESREHWQKRLHLSKIPLDAKRYIKQLENDVIDGNAKSFEALWSKIEKVLEMPGGLSQSTLVGLIDSALATQLNHVDRGAIDNALTGLYSSGKEHAYSLTDFKAKKIKRLKKLSSKQAFLKEAVTIDTVEDKLMLQHLKETALKNVKSIANKELRDKILEALTAAGSENENPLELANKIIQEESEKLKEKGKEQFKKMLEELYGKQQYQIQRIMRTESMNGFVLAQLQGYKEQGIVAVRWKALQNDPKVCNLCKTLDGNTFEIEYLLSEGGRYPLTFMSHPNCRCGFEPVIAFVSFDDFEKEYAKTHPDQFIQGEPIFNEELLGLEDILKDFKAGSTKFDRVPVEHAEELESFAKKVDNSPLADSAPPQVKFVQDVFETDAYQQRGRTDESKKGQVDSWYDPETKTTWVSSYATQFSSPSEVMARDWASRVWRDNGTVRKWFTSHFDGETVSDRKVSPAALEILQQTFKPFALASTYYLESGDALGLTAKTRALPEDQLREILSKLGLSKTDVSSVLKGRDSHTLWSMTSGEVVDTEETNKFVSEHSRNSALQLFVDSFVSYVTSPYILEHKDPKAFEFLRDSVFKGEAF